MADMSRRRSTNGNSSSDSRKRKYEQIASTNGDADSDGSSCDYPCPHCSAVFVTSLSLNRHVLMFHDGLETTEPTQVKEEEYNDNDGGNEEEEEEDGEGGLEEDNGSQGTFEDSVAANNGYYYENEEEGDDGQGYVYETGDGNEEVGDFDISQLIDPSSNEGHEMDYSHFLGDGGQMQNDGVQNRAPKTMPSLLPQQKNPKPKLSPEVLANVLAQVEEITAAATGDFVTCPLCRKTFGRKELSIHVSCEHGGAKFSCPYCQRIISRRDHLKRHIQNVHPEMCNESEIGPFPRNLNLCRANYSQKKPAPTLLANNTNGNASQMEQRQQQQIHQSPPKALPISIMTPRIQVDQEEEDEEDDFEGEDMQNQNNGYYQSNGAEDDGEEDSMQITVEPELPFQDLNDYNDDEYSGQEDFVDSLLQFGQKPQVPTTTASTSVMQRAQLTIDNMAYQCSLCNAVFSSKVLLDRHESTHSELRPHKCSLCGKGFLRKEHLSKHLSSVHSGMKFTCEFCGKDISRKDHLIRHIRNVHPNQFYSLSQDGTGDQELSSQAAHIQNVAMKAVQSLQPRPKKPFFNCDMCEATFINIDDLHVHQSTVHADVRKYKCNYCAKAFKRKEHLTKHEVLHTGERKFNCRVCGSEFHRKETLQDHIRRMHGISSTNVTVNGSNGSTISTIPCNLCDQLFQDRSTLLSHMTTAHGLIVNSPPGHPKNSQQNQVQRQTNGHGQLKPNNGISSASAKNLNQKPVPQLNGSNLGSLMDLINKGSITLSFHPIKQEQA